MSNMYSKPGYGKEKILYDSNGIVIGRGVTDSNGKTIYTGTNGQYVGKSYEMPSGTTKYYDANNNYAGTGISHSAGASRIDCSGGVPMSSSRNTSHSGYSSGADLDGCASSLILFAIAGVFLLILQLFS